MITGDISNAIAFSQSLIQLEKEFNKPIHVNNASKAAFSVLASSFQTETDAMSQTTPETMHHVYEWNHVGDPAAALFKLKLSGRGVSREISWEWKASKTTVPIDITPTGKKKFPEGFDTSKLHKIHTFVWKAPMMEYGMSVKIKPKLSKYLVFPNHRLNGKKVVFYSQTVQINKVGNTQGNFTQWFVSWFQNRAPVILNASFEKPRDKKFAYIFRNSASSLKGTSVIRFNGNANAAAKAKNIAMLISGELNREYINMARNRKYYG